MTRDRPLVPCVGCVGVFNEPLSDLTKILASLVDKANRICIPGFLDRVRPNTLAPALSRLDSSAEFSLSGYREALGVPQLARVPPHAKVCFGKFNKQCGIAPPPSLCLSMPLASQWLTSSSFYCCCFSC